MFITGATGFAGRHLVDACHAAGDLVCAPSRQEADLVDADATRAAVAAAAPAVVYHLAALAHVGKSWRHPDVTIAGNQAITLNLLEAVRTEAPDAVVVAVSSGEVYGPPEALPVDERALLRPRNPYAVSKAACDLLAGFYRDAHGLRIVTARAFNHSGPGQSPNYAVSSFARQVAVGLERGDARLRVLTGNPDTRRDYTDVRDVVRAYRALAHAGDPGVFNVCSGRASSARELLAALAASTGIEITHEVDPDLLRPHDVPEIRGSWERLHSATGWAPAISPAQTLADTVAWWRSELRPAGVAR